MVLQINQKFGYRVVSRTLKTSKVMGLCTAQSKILLFCAKTIMRESYIDCLKEENRFWKFGYLLVRYICDDFSHH